MSKCCVPFLFVASVAAQQAAPAAPPPMVHQLFACQSLERFDPAEPEEGAQAAAERLERLLKLLLQNTDGKPMNGIVQLARSRARGQVLLVHAVPDKLEIARSVFEQLGKSEPLAVRLQCSLLTMPKAVAAAHQLAAAGTRQTEAAALVKLTRDVVRSGGTLQNLTELSLQALAPLAVDTGGKVGGEERRELQVRAEMVPVAGDRAAVAMHVVRRLPKTADLQDPTRDVMSPLLELRAGGCTVTSAIVGDVATVLVVRCLELAPAPLAAPAVGGR